MSEEQRGSRTRSESLGRREGNCDCFRELENGRGECCWDKKTVHLRLRCTLTPFFRLLIVSPHNQVSHVTLRSWIVVYNAVDSQLGHLSVFDWLQDQNLNLPLQGCLLSSLTSSVTVYLFRCYKFRQSTFDLPLFTYYFVTFLWSISEKCYSTPITSFSVASGACFWWCKFTWKRWRLCRQPIAWQQYI